MEPPRAEVPGFFVSSLIFRVTSIRFPRSGVWPACRMFEGVIQEHRSEHAAAHAKDGVPAGHS